METITNAIELKEAILHLESAKAEQGLLLKEEFIHTILQINPMERLEEQMNQVSPFSWGGSSFVSKIAGVLSGFLIKKWIIGNNGNPVRQALGSVIQLLATTLISQQSGRLGIMGRLLFQLIFSKPRKEYGTE